MDNSLLYVVLLFIALIISYYSWRKERDRIDLYYMWIYSAGVLALVWQAIMANLLQPSGSAALINKYFLFAFWLAEAITWVVVTIKYYQKKRA